MKLVKGLSVLVAVAGLALLVVAVAPSVSGQSSPQGRTADGAARRGRELTILAGRGAEIGVSVRDLEASDKARAGVVVEEVRQGSPAEPPPCQSAPFSLAIGGSL